MNGRLLVTACLCAYASGAMVSTGREACLRISRGGSPTMAAAAEMRRVLHGVDNLEATTAFYTSCLGMAASEDGDSVQLTSSAGGLGLELRREAGAAFVAVPGYQHREGAGYQGTMAWVPSVADAVAKAVANGGTVLREEETINHGASLEPEEDEELDNPVVEALVADPCGYPVLLCECAEATAPCIAGVRMAVHTWKKSQAWYEGLGWKTVRWNSNVHREASLTVSLSAAVADPPIGPRGSLPPATTPILQLNYIYGSTPVPSDKGGFGGLVFAAADGESPAELADEDGYKVVLE